MSRPTPDRPEEDEDEDEDLLTRLVSQAGDPKVEPRPEHVAALRALLLDRLGPPRAARPRRTRTRWLMVSGLVAACSLAVLARARRDVEDRVPGPDPGRPAPRVTLRPPDDSSATGLAAWLEARRGLDGTKNPTFNWPLQETVSLTVSSPIPFDLLD